MSCGWFGRPPVASSPDRWLVGLGHLCSHILSLSQDIGLFGLYAVVPPEKLRDFSGVLMQNLVRMAHDVTPEEVEKAKTQLKVRIGRKEAGERGGGGTIKRVDGW